MLIYEYKPSIQTFTLLAPLLPGHVQVHVKEIMEAGLDSQFYCKIEDKHPHIQVYLIEHNQAESYSVCHLFSSDRIGSDYEYQNLCLEQARSLDRFISQLPLI